MRYSKQVLAVVGALALMCMLWFYRSFPSGTVRMHTYNSEEAVSTGNSDAAASVPLHDGTDTCPECPECPECPSCTPCSECLKEKAVTVNYLMDGNTRPWTTLPHDWRTRMDTVHVGAIVLHTPIKCVITAVPLANRELLLRFVLRLSGREHADPADPASFDLLRSLSTRQAEAILNDPAYHKVIFVRNPYTRLLWGYLQYSGESMNVVANIGIPSDSEDRADSTALAQTAPPLSTTFKPPHATTATKSFSDFVAMVSTKPQNEVSQEWMVEQSALGAARVLDYQHIGRFESFSEDFRRIFTQIGAFQALGWSSTEIDVFLQPLDALPDDGDLMEDMEMQYTHVLYTSVHLRYEEDFLRFGYPKRWSP